ncbi:hypothetical protein RSOLAG1IB_07479 [Rhizoctonia solani AG-1 IB]|uniref:Uncharacterized protein n=1 Tax=Thanatephorus cucumeris (strain AG1-IB / isolate 7/3/14) TaxID=1108050 RepID=A0A0B7FA94_THACB|nr:hypothetical protein RSOLAG1IB_07479 [Rhizoctonia solani AG-1 IB]
MYLSSMSKHLSSLASISLSIIFIMSTISDGVYSLELPFEQGSLTDTGHGRWINILQPGSLGPDAHKVKVTHNKDKGAYTLHGGCASTYSPRVVSGFPPVVHSYRDVLAVPRPLHRGDEGAICTPYVPYRNPLPPTAFKARFLASIRPVYSPLALQTEHHQLLRSSTLTILLISFLRPPFPFLIILYQHFVSIL